MERLTARTDLGLDDYNEICFINPDDPEGTYNLDDIVNYGSDETKLAIAERLAQYEDAEEEGRLIRLPCKVGDKVFIRIPHCSTGSQMLGILPPDVIVAEMEVWSIAIRKGTIRISDDDRYSGDFGKTVFLTREEAEKALKG